MRFIIYITFGLALSRCGIKTESYKFDPEAEKKSQSLDTNYSRPSHPFLEIDSTYFNRKVDGEYIKWPKFPGGEESLNQYVKANYKRPYGIDSLGVSINVNVLIDQNGQISKIFEFDPIPQCDACSDSIRSVINKLPKFNPAYYVNGKGKFIRYTSAERPIEIFL